MCLSLEKGRTTLKKADEDIVCYKVLVKNNEKGVIKSPYMCKPYKLGELKKDKLPVKKELFRTKTTIESGVFHTFKFFEDAKKSVINAIICNCFGFFEGNYPIVVKCFIPKGCMYYEGMFGSILTPTYQCYGSKKLKVGEEITYMPTVEDVEKNCPETLVSQIKEQMQKIMFIPKERFNQ